MANLQEEMVMSKFSKDHEEDENEGEIKKGGFPLASCMMGLLCFPITIFSCYTLDEREHAVILKYGQYDEYITESGCHWSNMFGRDIKKFSYARQTVNLPVTKIVDLNGNPLHVSAVVTYYIKDARKAALNVVAPGFFVRDQALAILKQVVSRYPYEAHDGSASLKAEPMEVGREMVKLLQRKVAVAGCKVLSFDLDELAYAPEIASGMLRRQQADALVSARKTIVQGSVEIAFDAVGMLSNKGIHMDAHHKTRLATNLLTVTCADRDAQPVLKL